MLTFEKNSISMKKSLFLALFIMATVPAFSQDNHSTCKATSFSFIVGFPGETAEEFEETLTLIEQVRFDALFTFIFSPRPGTPAARMDDPTPKAEKNARFDRLVALQNRISEEKHRAYIGKTVRVLCDGREEDRQADSGSDTVTPDGRTVLTARTDGGRLVRFPGDESLIGKFVQVKITDATTWSLVGSAEGGAQ